MKLSIITPSYQHAPYVERTIRSVLDQNYGDLEYWVIDGGSTDGTVDILRRYEDRLHWISEADQGQGDALNKGFARISGEIVGWLNSDDTYLPDTFETVLAAFEQNPDVNFVCGECHTIDEEDRRLYTWRNGPFDLRRLVRSGYSYILQPTVFFRRELLEKVEGCDLSLQYALDYDLWCRMGPYIRPLYFDRALANWRFLESSKTRSARRDSLVEGKRIRRKYLTSPLEWPLCWYFDLRVELYLRLEPFLIRESKSPA